MRLPETGSSRILIYFKHGLTCSSIRSWFIYMLASVRFRSYVKERWNGLYWCCKSYQKRDSWTRNGTLGLDVFSFHRTSFKLTEMEALHILKDRVHWIIAGCTHDGARVGHYFPIASLASWNKNWSVGLFACSWLINCQAYNDSHFLRIRRRVNKRFYLNVLNTHTIRYIGQFICT